MSHEHSPLELGHRSIPLLPFDTPFYGLPAQLFPRLKTSFPSRAFSLIEVVFALGITSFCIVALVGLFAVGMKTETRPRLDMPDPNAPLIAQLSERIAALEARLAELERKNAASSV